MNSKQVYKLAEELPEVSVKDHFGGDGFSAHKRVFMTVWHDQNKANLRLSLQEQQRFLSIDGEAFQPIDNAWGRQGWTTVNLEFVEKADFEEALISAWEFSKTKNVKQSSTIEKPSEKKKPIPKKKATGKSK